MAQFDGRSFVGGQLQKLEYLRTSRELSTEEYSRASAALEHCSTQLKDSYRVEGLPDAALASLLFSCLNFSGWTVDYADLIIN